MKLMKEGDLRLSGPPSRRGTGGGARTCDRRVFADLRADTLATVSSTPLDDNDDDDGDDDDDDDDDDVYWWCKICCHYKMSSKKVNSTATARLKQDFMRIMKDPVPYIQAAPLPSNILEWHYIVEGPENSAYEGGLYHGKLVFPREFPFKPPSIYMHTPNGRFKCNTRLCLSISDFHPDTWNPAWSVSTILTGLLSFMLEKSPTLGSIETSLYTKRQLAAQSGAFNLNNKTFCDLFPDVAEKIRDQLKKQAEELKKARESTNNSNSSQTSLPNSNGEAVVLDHNGGAGGDRLAGAGIGGPVVAAAGGAPWYLRGTMTNMLVIVGFAAFAFVVKHVLTNVVEMK
ncbi:ubiquitin-conjugating enzyme e2 j2 [Plakobranchus ocellatus]|uniref:Ubiquitin-conjugating enzyme E2 J2 n=1 Tax=Plakobranchus ocellatus TaxID=259542 RepID=A0AAV3YXC5_9GAST|nr:ubiquitin-conjugating enzyme e2 j2 [Plakobranchus ocellatus]